MFLKLCRVQVHVSLHDQMAIVETAGRRHSLLYLAETSDPAQVFRCVWKFLRKAHLLPVSLGLRLRFGLPQHLKEAAVRGFRWLLEKLDVQLNARRRRPRYCYDDAAKSGWKPLARRKPAATAGLFYYTRASASI